MTQITTTANSHQTKSNKKLRKNNFAAIYYKKGNLGKPKLSSKNNFKNLLNRKLNNKIKKKDNFLRSGLKDHSNHYNSKSKINRTKNLNTNTILENCISKNLHSLNKKIFMGKSSPKGMPKNSLLQSKKVRSKLFMGKGSGSPKIRKSREKRKLNGQSTRKYKKGCESTLYSILKKNPHNYQNQPHTGPKWKEFSKLGKYDKLNLKKLSNLKPPEPGRLTPRLKKLGIFSSKYLTKAGYKIPQGKISARGLKTREGMRLKNSELGQNKSKRFR